jgi:hypothetical protein
MPTFTVGHVQEGFARLLFSPIGGDGGRWACVCACACVCVCACVRARESVFLCVGLSISERNLTVDKLLQNYMWCSAFAEYRFNVKNTHIMVKWPDCDI